MVTGVDIWDINADESVAYQYSRYNYNATDFFDGPNPFAASDHNPEVVGLNLAGAGTRVRSRSSAPTTSTAGSTTPATRPVPPFAGAVKQLRGENPNTVFAAAGDLIGASTFESFIQQDKPTIDALNEAGLEVSAVGNHEFDQGYDDLVNRVMAPYVATNPRAVPSGSTSPPTSRQAGRGRDASRRPGSKTFGGVEVGFVGAVTEDLPALVNPDGIADIEVTDIVDPTNAAARTSRPEGADVVVLLVHEGAADHDVASATDQLGRSARS